MAVKTLVVRGQKFGRLRVICELSSTTSRRFSCRCICGNKVDTALPRLLSGKTKSCGCLRKEISSETGKLYGGRTYTKHGIAGTALYNCYLQMMGRCYNKEHPRYKDWGGRGIKVCRRWHSLESFIQWNDSLPKNKRCQPGLSIERSNNLGNYTPKNCYWATLRQQQRNTRSNVYVRYRGKNQSFMYAYEDLVVRGLIPKGYSERIRRRLRKGEVFEDIVKGFTGETRVRWL